MEQREHFNRDAGLTGEMSVRFDVATGRVFTRGSGFWSHRQVSAFFADWKTIISRIHLARQSLSALVDMRESGVQRADVAELIATVTTDLYREGDAIAMVVPNSLAKIQMRRVLDTRYHQFFLSQPAAETWLHGRALGVRPVEASPLTAAAAASSPRR